MIKSVGSLVFPLIIFSYVSRTISVAGVGRVDFARSIVAYFTMIASLGIQAYGVREGAKIRDNKEAFSDLIKELFLINIITTIIAYIVFFVVLNSVDKFHEDKILFFICSISIGFTALGLEWVYGALEEYKYIAVRSLIFQAISVVLVFIFVRTEADYSKYAWIIVFSTVGSNLFNFIHARQFFVKTKTVLNLKRHVKPIVIFFSNTLAGNVYLTLDTSMIGLLSTEYAVGLYSASIKLNRICVALLSALSAILLPRFSYFIANGEMERYKAILKKSVDISLMFSIPSAVGLFILAKEILLIFSGADFLDAIECSRILTLIVVIIPMSTIVASEILIPFHRENYQLYATVVGAMSNITVNGLLIPKYHEIGAAVSTVISECIVLIILLYGAKKYANIRKLFENTFHYIVATVPMAIIIMILNNIADGVLKLFLLVPIGVIVYFVTLIILKDTIVSDLLSKRLLL